ncbi:class III extradiol dioxygenase subunit B-like domain-containing protein [Antrihabitans cavernicola]|uniref:Extradiol ring-cleavage dioxygenase class III enzyme subunit B domain-containing protein n=1 Tax=Antrihabitans cavernicola TaxID=2495913 RepID=A0A5A7SB39_9NOCA|nr:class III extradiol dioxygenase subunit B-like domain-containing protein [Spelaeibacter cavernicola]KAA0023348.1 hypothetical protein FOY51_08000 [Spelaeibacter cavernicola]
MFTAAALVPSPPVLVPELNGADATATAELRDAALAVVTRLADSASVWTVLGTGATEQTISSDAVGSFAGFGVDVPVSLSPDPASTPDLELPLAALVAGWLRGRVAPHAVVDVRIFARDSSPMACADAGARLRRDLDADPQPHGLLVIADGANTLTPKAPGSFDPRSPEFQNELDEALAAGDCAAIAQLDPVVCEEFGAFGRAAWQVLASVFDSVDDKPDATTLYSSAPFGVGYHVGLWMP